MTVLLRLLVFLAAACGLAVAYTGAMMARAILLLPEEWMGGADPNLTAAWLAIAVVGCGFTGIASFLAFWGAILGRRSRVAAALLLCAPGFVGSLIGVGVFVLLIAVQPGWDQYVLYVPAIGASPLVYFAVGSLFLSFHRSGGAE